MQLPCDHFSYSVYSPQMSNEHSMAQGLRHTKQMLTINHTVSRSYLVR